MEMYNSNPIMDVFLISTIFIAMWIFTFKFRTYFSDVSLLPSMHVAIKCALFWAGVLTIICLGVLVFELFYSRYGSGVFKEAIYFSLVPVAAIIGALYGYVFVWLTRNKNLNSGVLSRGLVGFAIGLVIGITFSLVSAFGLDISYHIEPGYGAIIELGFLYLFPLCIIACTLFLGLFTPRNVLLSAVK